MPDEPFLLVSLEEEKAKKLAQVLSNDTARKILDFLSKRETASETDISKALDVPLSTVHYNMKLLSQSDLVDDDSFSYSEKGKEVTQYALTNKYVIIAPRKTQAVMDQIKKFLPVLLISAAAAAVVKYWPRWIVEEAAQDSAEIMAARVPEAMPLANEAVSGTQEIAVWFLLGTVFAMLVYFVWAEIILKKLKS